MKYIRQFGIILGITALGEIFKHIIPLPIPGSIYGLILMLIFLFIGFIKIVDVKDTSKFLIEIMPLMFIPVAASIISTWNILKSLLIPIIVIVPITTIIVMVSTGKITDFIILNSKEKIDE